MAHRVEFTPRALKEFEAQEHMVRGRILRALVRLAADPYRSAAVKALEGGGYRLRGGDSRVLFIIENDRLVVLLDFLAGGSNFGVEDGRRVLLRRPCNRC